MNKDEKEDIIVLNLDAFEGGTEIDPSYFNFNILTNMWTSWTNWYWDSTDSDEKKEKDNVEDIIGCDHDWVNVSFVHLKFVCKKCNKDKP